MKLRALVLILALGGCIEDMPPDNPPSSPVARAGDTGGRVTERTLVQVAGRVIPVAEDECRARTRGMRCDFALSIDRKPGQAPNAFQTVDGNGRPVLIVNTALLADLRNSDELAFIMGHESAHHIRNHLARTNATAMTGAVLGGVLAGVLGGDVSTIDSAQRAGALVGSRTYSKEFELEADALGTVIAAEAGYDPVLGAQYFTRISDPGNAFLGTHPPNAARLDTVRRVAAGL